MEGSKKNFVVPLLGYPGLNLTKATVRQVLSNADTHYETIHACVEAFCPDAIFSLMDLTVEAEALGAKITISENQPPSVVAHIISTEDDIKTCRIPDPAVDGRMPLFVKVMEKMKKHLHIPRGAYVIGPLTLAGEIAGVKNVMKMLIRQSTFVETLLELTAEVSTRYARRLVNAGADIICILEPTAALISASHFSKFSRPYVEAISTSVNAVTVLHICGNTTPIIPEMIKTQVNGISIDSAVDIIHVLGQTNNKMAVIGNLDPIKAMVFDPPEKIREKVLQLRTQAAQCETALISECHKGFGEMHESMTGIHCNFILSTGCDLPPEVPVENVRAFMEAGREPI